ncbi:unnamed protein product [Calypogeia fissa]
MSTSWRLYSHIFARSWNWVTGNHRLQDALRNKDHPLVRTLLTHGKAELKVMGINIDGLADDVLKQKILDVAVP